MNILQISDIHAARSNVAAFGERQAGGALRRTVEYLLDAPFRADLLVVTGDVSHDGSLESYALVREELGRLSVPALFVPGNHDSRRPMQEAGLLPKDPESELRVVDAGEAVLLLADSTVPGRPRGRFLTLQQRAVLKALREAEGRPVFLFQHHPPFATGYTAMDLPMIGRELFDEIFSYENLVFCCGHLHAALEARIGKASAVICPPVFMEMEFDLTEEGGKKFYLTEPRFALHTVESGRVLTHFASVPTGEKRVGPFSF